MLADKDSFARPLNCERVCRLLGIASSSIRLETLHLLSRAPRTVGELADRLEVDRANLSMHLARLRRAKLVWCRKVGRTRLYSTTEHVTVTVDENEVVWSFSTFGGDAVRVTVNRAANTPRLLPQKADSP